jgi:hypothetical protein
VKRELNAPPCDMARARWAEADRESPRASEAPLCERRQNARPAHEQNKTKVICQAHLPNMRVGQCELHVQS